MTGKVLFMVKKEFFDAIERGDKTSEWRGFWWWAWVYRKKPEQAVFMCGRRILRKKILGIYKHEFKSSPESAQRIYPDDRFILEISLADGVLDA